MAQLLIKLMCLRCREPYFLPPGMNLADYCPTCRGRTGRRMDPARQAHMNYNWHWQRTHFPNALPDPTRPRAFVGKYFKPDLEVKA